jgi:glycosyltransferase involved in cell wall biosynthesis
MNRYPLVSVIIPAYNAERSIGRTLASVSAQTYENIEIVVVNDGSEDGTTALVAAAAIQDPRIRLLSQANRGMAAARNAAAAAARGTVLAPCDADDLWHPRKVERQVEALWRAPDGTGVVYCWVHGIDDRDRIVFPGWKRETLEGDVHEAMIVDSLAGCGSVPLIVRRVFDSVGRYSSECGMNDDWRLYIALSAVCGWIVVPEYLVGYRLGAANASRDYRLMEKTLAADTEWIRREWPATTSEILARRSHTVNCYLGFLAARGGCVLTAMRYRLAALQARPVELFRPSWLGFLYVLALRMMGLERYYFPFWRAPATWSASE